MRSFLTVFWALLLIACQSDTTEKVVRAEDSSATAILPLADIPDKRIQLLARELRLFYGMKIGVLPRKAMPENSRLKSTDRYSAPAILEWLKKQKPTNYDRILGVTTRDIYTRKGPYPHWGIFGLGYKPGDACIVSEFRLKQFGNNTDTFLTLVTLHEIGHNLGLPHCAKHPSCLMNDAKGKAKTLFSEKKWLCSNCRTLLKKS
jgi:archaemetzincin